MKITPIDKFLIFPISRFIDNSTTSGIVLFVSAVIALALANSPLQEAYHHFWEHTFTLSYDNYEISKSLHHWINDGLMSIFFFVVGLELKREIVGGELSQPKDAILPIFAGLGGMIAPAVLYLIFNPSGESSTGWGVPMATDIAFALGILYLLGDRVPLALKVFLTALAIVDDLGAVMVIAIFYTSDVSTASLLVGGGFLAILLIANYIGVRNIAFYGAVGVFGLWLAFSLSGVHATIAGVIAAFTIPASVKIEDKGFVAKMNALTNEFEHTAPNNISLLTPDQLHIINRIRFYSKAALTPLQRLEHAMHPLVGYIVMPIFALANAGITFSGEFVENMVSNVSIGVMLGLVMGKFVGIVSITTIITRLKLAVLPEGVKWQHIYGVALIASVGFTMSLFITDLAFVSKTYILQAKIGIFIASVVGGSAGFLILSRA